MKGWIASMVIGGAFPAQALLCAYLIGALIIPDKLSMRSRSNFLSIWWVLIAAVEFIAYIAQGWAFGHSAENMVPGAKFTNSRNAGCELNYFAPF